jgi:hypothetical protein
MVECRSPMWHGVDFASAWKVISIILTASFGILGLTKDFRDKHTKKITKWGRLSMGGIILSCLGGVAAEVRGYYNEANKADRAEAERKELLGKIDGSLAPLTAPTVRIRARADCSADDDSIWLCRNEDSFLSEQRVIDKDLMEVKPEAYFFKSREKLKAFMEEGGATPALVYRIRNGSMRRFKPSNSLDIEFFDTQPTILSNTGSIRSLNDLQNAWVLLYLFEKAEKVDVDDFEITIPSGEKVHMKWSENLPWNNMEWLPEDRGTIVSIFELERETR